MSTEKVLVEIIEQPLAHCVAAVTEKASESQAESSSQDAAPLLTEQASPELLAQPVFDAYANVFEKILDVSFDKAKLTAATGGDKSSESPVLVDTAKVGEDANKGSDSGRVTTEAASTDKPEQAVAVDGVDTAKCQVWENNATVEKG